MNKNGLIFFINLSRFLEKICQSLEGCILTSKQHHFEIGQLVWKFIPKNSRKKWDDTFCGPYQIKSHQSPTTLNIGDYKAGSQDMKVHHSDLKPCRLPAIDTSIRWQLNNRLLHEYIIEWRNKYGFPSQVIRTRRLDLPSAQKLAKKNARGVGPEHLMFLDGIRFTNDFYEKLPHFFEESNLEQFAFLCPELPCLPYWSQVNKWTAKWIPLPGKPDDLMTGSLGQRPEEECGRRPAGRFAFTIWLVCFCK